MRYNYICEEQFKVMDKRVKDSRGGVKEHTAVGGRGRGAVSERQPVDRSDRSTQVGTTVKSSTRTFHATNPYRSKWEAAYAAKLELEKQAGVIKAYWYEPFSLWLPGKVRYKPDFLVEYHPANPWGGQISPNIEVIEVKGWSKNRRDGMTRLKIAAALFPCFVWRMVYKTKGGGWDGEYV